MRARILVASVSVLAVVIAGVAVVVGLRVNSIHQRPRPSPTQLRSSPRDSASSAQPTPRAGSPIVYVYYYLWWTPSHWLSKLGTGYPTDRLPLARPGDTDASGCQPSVRYSGATIVDVPSQGLYDQNDLSVYGQQIAEAAKAGITGFLVSWQGTGAAVQSPSASGYDQRLALIVEAVAAYNRHHPADPFRLGLALSAFGDYARPTSEIVNDLNYFLKSYGSNSDFVNAFSPRPVVMIMDSRKYPLATVSAIWASGHSSAYLVGDETAASWPRDAPYLDAASYYWSSENPVKNTRAGSTLVDLGNQIHSDGKKWFAPLIPGYDTQLTGGSCVPRDSGETMRTVWDTNAQSHPDAWFGISWNEFVENTYLQPSVGYGDRYLSELSQLIRSG